MIAIYHRDVKNSRMEAIRRRALEGIKCKLPCVSRASAFHRRCCTEAYQSDTRTEQRDAVQRRQLELVRDVAVEGTARSSPCSHLC